MIEMPNRSVTRFFVPFIDVMMLMFSLFLLLPNVQDETEPEPKQDEKKKESLDRIKELQKANELLAVEKEDLKNKLTQLRLKSFNELKKDIRFLYIDPINGEVSYHDPHDLKNPKTIINSAQDARDLIDRLSKQAKSKELFYAFMLPPPGVSAGFPNDRQLTQLRQWFAQVANSLPPPRK